MQELLNAIERLNQALTEAEKRKHAHFAAGFIAGALAGGITGAAPTHTHSYIDGLSESGLDDWADLVEAVEWAMPEENNP